MDTGPAAGSGSDEPALDRAHLERQTFGDAALQADLLQLFAERIGSLLPRILSPSSAADGALAAHALAGAALAVGAWRVAEAARACEEGQGAGDALAQAAARALAWIAHDA